MTHNTTNQVPSLLQTVQSALSGACATCWCRVGPPRRSDWLQTLLTSHGQTGPACRRRGGGGERRATRPRLGHRALKRGGDSGCESRRAGCSLRAQQGGAGRVSTPRRKGAGGRKRGRKRHGGGRRRRASGDASPQVGGHRFRRSLTGVRPEF